VWNGPLVAQFANLGSYAEKMLVHENTLVKMQNDMGFQQNAVLPGHEARAYEAVTWYSNPGPSSSTANLNCGWHEVCTNPPDGGGSALDWQAATTRQCPSEEEATGHLAAVRLC